MILGMMMSQNSHLMFLMNGSSKKGTMIEKLLSQKTKLRQRSQNQKRKGKEYLSIINWKYSLMMTKNARYVVLRNSISGVNFNKVCISISTISPLPGKGCQISQ